MSQSKTTLHHACSGQLRKTHYLATWQIWLWIIWISTLKGWIVSRQVFALFCCHFCEQTEVTWPGHRPSKSVLREGPICPNSSNSARDEIRVLNHKQGDEEIWLAQPKDNDKYKDKYQDHLQISSKKDPGDMWPLRALIMVTRKQKQPKDNDRGKTIWKNSSFPNWIYVVEFGVEFHFSDHLNCSHLGSVFVACQKETALLQE